MSTQEINSKIKHIEQFADLNDVPYDHFYSQLIAQAQSYARDGDYNEALSRLDKALEMVQNYGKSPTDYIYETRRNSMRLTKGQLKRIIREEYTRLKRRGLLREFGPVPGDEMDDFEDEKGAAPYSPKKGRRTTGGDRYSQALAALEEDILACANGSYHDHFDGTGNYYSCISTWKDKLSLSLDSWLNLNGFKDVADNSKMYNKLFREAERFIEDETDFDPWVQDYNWD